MLLSALLCVAAPAFAEIPRRDGFVTDQTEMIPSRTQDELEERLTTYRESTGIGVYVLVVPTLAGEDLASYAQTVRQAWRMGEGHINNDVLMLVVTPPEKKAYISTGPEVSPYLPSGECIDIVANVMKPLNLRGERVEAIVAGVDAVTGRLGDVSWSERVRQGAASATTEEGVDDSVLCVIVSVVVGLFLFCLWLFWPRNRRSSYGRGYGGSYGGGGGSSSTTYVHTTTYIDTGSYGGGGGGGGSDGGGGGGDGGGGGGGDSG